MYIQALLMTEEQVNLVCQRNSSELSCESTDSDESTDGIDENWINEQCTTADFIWDVNTSEPIQTEYDLIREMNDDSYIDTEPGQ